jgi:hypothetical protein
LGVTKPGLVALCATLLAASDCLAQAGQSFSQRRFDGTTAPGALCSFLLEARERAEIEGRLDFDATVESVGGEASAALIARVSTGSPYAIRQIQFTGHRKINDTTLRRTLKVSERDMLDVRRLRRSLTGINQLGMFHPLSLEDVVVTRLDDGVTVDLTIQLRERKPRWWSIAGVLLPGTNPLKASIATRLPPWGRGIFETATYFASLNVMGFGAPFLAIERSLIPGQEWLSGFAISPSLSPRAMADDYARRHALYAISGALDHEVDEPFSVDIESATGSAPAALTCKPPKPRLWWLRMAARQIVAIYS